jgi:hypothetical protein
MAEDAAAVAARRAALSRQADHMIATAHIVLAACYAGFVAALVTTVMRWVFSSDENASIVPLFSPLLCSYIYFVAFSSDPARANACYPPRTSVPRPLLPFAQYLWPLLPCQKVRLRRRADDRGHGKQDDLHNPLSPGHPVPNKALGVSFSRMCG